MCVSLLPLYNVIILPPLSLSLSRSLDFFRILSSGVGYMSLSVRFSSKFFVFVVIRNLAECWWREHSKAMLRVLRATVARSRRTSAASFFARYTKSVAPAPSNSSSQTLHFTFLRTLSSRQGKNGYLGPKPNHTSRIQDSLDSSEDCNYSASAEEDNILAAPETEDDEGDMVAESVEDPPTAELDEDSTFDTYDVPEDLKEMLEDGYEIESGEEDLSLEGTSELLTIDEVKQVLEEARAKDVQIFSVQDRCEWTDVMAVATGDSDRHVRGIADALVYKIKKKGNIESPLYPTIEGQAGGNWLVVDCGNIVIHVLNEDSRAYYRLEDLWTGDVKPSTIDEEMEKMLNQAGLKDVVP